MTKKIETPIPNETAAIARSSSPESSSQPSLNTTSEIGRLLVDRIDETLDPLEPTQPPDPFEELEQPQKGGEMDYRPFDLP